MALIYSGYGANEKNKAIFVLEDCFSSFVGFF